MRFISLALLAALPLLGMAPAAVVAKDTPAAPVISAEDAALIARATARGRLMYAYDQAAWHGTDDLRMKLPDFATKVEGWIVDGPAEAPQLVFYSRDKDSPKAVYVADFRDYKLVSSKVLGPGDDAALSPARLKMIDARRRAKAAMIAGNTIFCANESPNSIVLPPETAGGPYLVYFLTPQTSNKSVPVGGHFLFEVAADGVVAPPRRFTKACMELPTQNSDGGETEAIVATHLLDPVPTEIHVFTMYAAHLPVFVITTQNRRLWILSLIGGQPKIELDPRPLKN